MTEEKTLESVIQSVEVSQPTFFIEGGRYRRHHIRMPHSSHIVIVFERVPDDASDEVTQSAWGMNARVADFWSRCRKVVEPIEPNADVGIVVVDYPTPSPTPTAQDDPPRQLPLPLPPPQTKPQS